MVTQGMIHTTFDIISFNIQLDIDSSDYGEDYSYESLLYKLTYDRFVPSDA